MISFDFTNNEKNEFPFELEKVTLGPKCPESDINIKQLERYIKAQNINISENFSVEKSKIDTYR